MASSTLTIAETQTEFTPAQKQALASLGIGAAQPGELQIFLHECQKTGLDPFLKQIYFIRRGDKLTIQVGIDGLQTIARRAVAKTGEAFGEAPILWCGGDGVWRDIWLSPNPPAAAKACVKRGEGTFTAVALFREFAPVYNGKLSGLWAKMPAHMIGKVAMAHALRQAFPAEMSGVYTDDEMAQAGPAVQVPAQPVQAAPVQPKQPKQAQPAQPASPQPASPQPAAPVYDTWQDRAKAATAAREQQRQAATKPQPVATTIPATPQPSETQWAEQMKKKAAATTKTAKEPTK